MTLIESRTVRGGRLQTSLRSRQLSARARLEFRPAVEGLEIRLTPATSTWSGAVNNLWSNAGNWDVAPAAGSDLVFPAVTTEVITNDLAAGTSFNSIQIQAAGYDITGNSVAIITDIETNYASGTSTDDLATILAPPGGSTVSVGVAAGGTLAMGGVLSGTGGLNIPQPGTLVLDGTVSNSYAGITTVGAGLVELSPTAGQSAIPGDLAIGGFLIFSAEVQDTVSGGLSSASTVTVSPGSTFDLNGFNNNISGLAFNPAVSFLSTGALVETGAGTLTIGGINGIVVGTGPTASITGNLNLGIDGTMNIAHSNANASDLTISAVISGDAGTGIHKNGNGILLLTNTSTYTGTTAVNAGTLIVNGSIATSSGVTVATGATLAWNGRDGPRLHGERHDLAGRYRGPGNPQLRRLHACGRRNL